uniref:Uncharacterized protein n=1 Tax=Helianthus annuus TaxID=4232 RepID=A0A251TSI8_HELAN
MWHPVEVGRGIRQCSGRIFGSPNTKNGSYILSLQPRFIITSFFTNPTYQFPNSASSFFTDPSSFFIDRLPIPTMFCFEVLIRVSGNVLNITQMMIKKRAQVSFSFLN